MAVNPHMKRKILLVDDDEDDYLLTKEVLSEIPGHPYQLTWESSYEGGLEILNTEPWSAILVDYDLGSHNGLEFIQSVAKIGSRAPIIMVSGCADDKTEAQALAAGAIDFLHKEILSAPLLGRIIQHAQKSFEIEAVLEERYAQAINQFKSTIDELHLALEEAEIFKEELREQNERLIEANLCYEDFFEVTAIGYVVTDPYGVILRHNRTLGLMLNEDVNQLVLRTFSRYVEESDRTKFRTLLWELDRDSSNLKDEIVLRLKPRGADPFEVQLKAGRVFQPNTDRFELHWLVLMNKDI